MSKHLIFRAIRKLFRQSPYTNEFVTYSDQEANDYILERMKQCENGLMISKFGTTELDNLVCKEVHTRGIKASDYVNAIHGRYPIHIDEAINKLCLNSGFFPNDITLWEKYTRLVKKDMAEVDILGSYIKAESEVKQYLSSNCEFVNLDGFYAPFLWNGPWTRYLRGKKVLVVHPFAESIQKQYANRDRLFKNPDVLPEFAQLNVIKAVQSLAGNGASTGFEDWFDALEYMKSQMDLVEYDVTLIGCGAYGMHLAAHAKRRGKIAVQLAGWTQMLFGIYGERWIKDQPQYSKFINEYWIRPLESEKPKGAEKVEGGCYW